MTKKVRKKLQLIDQSLTNSGDLLWVQLHGSSWWPAQVVVDNTVSAIHKPRERRKGEVLVRLYGSYKYLFVDPISSRSEFEDTLEKYSGSYDAVLEESLKQDLHQLKFGTSKEKEMKMKGKVGSDVSQERKVKKKKNVISKTGTKKVSSSGCSSSRELDANSPAKRSKETSLGSVGTKENRSRKRKKEEAQKKSKSNSKRSESRKEEQDMKRKKPKANGAVSDAAKISQACKDARRKKKEKASKQEIVSTTLEETAEEPSARKLKVMRFLGLVSPPGSPFTQNGSLSNSA